MFSRIWTAIVAPPPGTHRRNPAAPFDSRLRRYTQLSSKLRSGSDDPGGKRLRRLGPALEQRDFRLWWLAMLGMGIGLQMLEVAIGWEVYGLHRSALDLGWIGLAEFVPLFVLALPAGQLSDRAPRRLVFAGALLLSAAVGVGLALVSAAGTTVVWPYLALAVAAGAAMALGWPAARAMPPTLVSVDALQNAMALRSIASQSGMVIGPAVGGLLYGVSPEVVYLVSAGCCGLASLSVLAMRPAPAA